LGSSLKVNGSSYAGGIVGYETSVTSRYYNISIPSGSGMINSTSYAASLVAYKGSSPIYIENVTS